MFQLRTQTLLAGLCCLLTASAAQADVGSSMVSYLNQNLGNRLGGGESQHLATEALRVSGGEFIHSELGHDSPGNGDSVWGTLVTEISVSNNNQWSDSNPSAECLPGDIIQYCDNAEIGAAKFGSHHTSVIKSVSNGNENGGSRPTEVYQQNFNNNRTVQSASIDTKQLSAGTLRIYRPQTSEDVINTYKITLVNNSASSQFVKVMLDDSTINTFTLSGSNTADSFLSYSISTNGTVPCLVLDDNVTTIYLETAKGNKIYNAANGNATIEQLSP